MVLNNYLFLTRNIAKIKYFLKMNNIKIEDVVSFGDVLRALFVANYTGVVALDADFANPWKTDTFDVQKQAVNEMVTTPGLRELNKGDTAKRNKFMDDMLRLTAKLDYAIGKCIAAGTITDSKGSFGVGTLNKTISDRNIGLFHTSYEVTLARINATGNAAALNAKGFTAVNLSDFSGLHDSAWGMNTTKINLKQDISTLSGNDKILVDTFMATCMFLIAGIRAHAKFVGNKELAKKASFNGVKKSVEPTAAKKARNISVKEFASRVFATDVPAKHKMQFILQTKDVTVTVCRQNLKTGVCSSGTTLEFGRMLEVVKSGILGSGEFIVVTNSASKKIVVKYLKIVVA